MNAARRVSVARHASLRSLTALTSTVLGLIAALVAAGLVWTSTLMERSVSNVIRDTRSQAIASELELSLLLYQRVSDVYLLTQEPRMADARVELVSEMNGLVSEAEDYAANVKEEHLMQEVSRNLTAYIQERKRAEEHTTSLETMLRTTRPMMEQSLGSLDTLRAMNETQVDRTHARSSELSKLGRVAGGVAGLLFALGLLSTMFITRRYVLQPMMGLHRTVSQFRAGEFEVRARDEGLREIAQLGQGFNELADSLMRQREDQLTFLSAVAHDLKNPLSGIRLGVHALERDQSESSRRRTRARLDRQVARLTRMVDDLLDATRVEAGRLETRKEEFDVREVIEDMIRLYAPTSPEHQFTTELPHEPALILGDPLRIEQVVSNLLSNAIKFSPAGGPVRVAVDIEDHEVVLSVSDRGIGIPPHELPNIFVPFRRKDPDIAPGAGLGLSVVRRIAKAHGGRVDVESEPGVGSTFRVVLPAASASRPASP